MQKKITERTFGVEFEFADVNKKAVSLPMGFSWSKEETITNTDGKRSTFSMEYGGEVNSPPLKLCQEDRKLLKSVFENLKEKGGKVTWIQALHVHIYAGDFSLSDLKKVFYLSYYTAPYIQEIAYIDSWKQETWWCPAPSLEYLQRVKEAKIEKDLFNVFANSMTKGYIRHLINIPSFFKRKTIEFRAYNNTDDFSEVENAILFSYKFIQYALTHTEEDFKQIDSFEKFQKALKFSRPLPKKTEPLIFSGNQHHPREAFVAKAKPLSSKMIKILSEQCSNNLACINPFLFHTELNMYQKTKITIYNVDEFNDIIYRIWKNKLKIKYCKTFDFLEGFNNETPARQITCLLLFFKMHKYARNTQYAKKELQSRIEKLNESLEKAEKVTEKLIHLFENSTYVFGTLYEALQNEENIFWQNGNNSKTRSVIVSLVKYSDYSKKTNPFNVSYYGVLDGLRENQKFMFVSENAYFKKVNKIAKQGKSIFYSSQKAKTKITQKQEKQQCISIEIPPNDLDISNHNKLKIIPVKPSEFSVIQREYVKKVHKTSGVYFSFLVFYENYCLGGFGFNFPKYSETNYDLWLLSDFSTNNQVFRLSKLILLCIQSQVVKKILQRKTKMEVNNCYTKVYTNQPVSMKYRGVFKKVKLEKESVLMYETDFGLYKENQEIIKAYQKMKKNNEK